MIIVMKLMRFGGIARAVPRGEQGLVRTGSGYPRGDDHPGGIKVSTLVKLARIHFIFPVVAMR